MTSFSFGGHTIGETNPCFIIAEACDNHLGNMDTAKEMIKRSKEAGADAVKFQHHIPDAEMLPDLPMSDNFDDDEPLYEFLKKYALTLEQHKELMAYASEIGITYMCTPFSYPAAKEMHDIGLSAFKIGSGEMTDLWSLRKIADFGKPMLISTGMCSFAEINRTYEAMCEKGIPFALLNCVSEYPPEYKDINLDVISEMQERYPLAVIGHSDHTPDLYTSFAAVTLGAKIIEKHVIISKEQNGPDREVSIEFDALRELVDGIRKIEAARGSDRSVHSKEEAVRTWAFRYVVAEKGLSAGEEITQEMLNTGAVCTKRTGRPDGVPSHEIEKLVGKVPKKDISPNSPVFWKDLEV